MTLEELKAEAKSTATNSPRSIRTLNLHLVYVDIKANTSVGQAAKPHTTTNVTNAD
jgi:hypothetical protein